MSKFKINSTDKALLDQMALDNDTAMRQGVQANGVDYATSIFPVSGLDLIVPIGTDAYNKSLDGIRAGMAVPMKYFGPFFGQYTVSSISPTKTFRQIPTVLGSYTFSDEISVARNALVSVQFGIQVASSAAHLLEYYVSVNGVDSNHLSFYIGDTNYRLITGTWVVNVQGNPTISLIAFKSNGSSGTNFTIDSNCSINMTISG